MESSIKKYLNYNINLVIKYVNNINQSHDIRLSVASHQRHRIKYIY